MRYRVFKSHLWKGWRRLSCLTSRREQVLVVEGADRRRSNFTWAGEGRPREKTTVGRGSTSRLSRGRAFQAEHSQGVLRQECALMWLESCEGEGVEGEIRQRRADRAVRQIAQRLHGPLSRGESRGVSSRAPRRAFQGEPSGCCAESRLHEGKDGTNQFGG